MDGCCFSDMANLRTIVCIDGCPEPPAVLDEYQPPGMSGRSSTLDAADVVFKGLSPARIKSSGGLGRSVAGHRSKLRLAPRHSRGWFGLRRVDLQYANLRAAAVETSSWTRGVHVVVLTACSSEALGGAAARCIPTATQRERPPNPSTRPSPAAKCTAPSWSG